MDGKSDNLETGSPSRIHTVPGPGKKQGYFELVDSLCRLDDEVFEEDLDDVLSRAAERGLSRFILGGLGPSGWSRQRELVRCNRGLAFSIGVHPWSVGRLPESLEECLTKMEVYFQHDIRPVALGEIGLDRGPNAVAEIHEQVRWLSGQLQFACTRNVPVILHVVRAHGALLEALNAQGVPERRGMVHGFQGPWEVAQAYLRIGMFLGFNGGLIRYGSTRTEDVVRRVPLEAVLLESDAPHQHPEKRAERNEPTAIFKVAEAIARIKGIEVDEVLAQASENARMLFGLDSGPSSP